MTEHHVDQNVSATGEPDPRFALANERTLLAWIRTALGLIAGGLALPSLVAVPLEERLRAVIGLPLVATGAVVALRASFAWRSRDEALREGKSLARSQLPAVVSLVVGIAAVIAVVFVLGSISRR